MTAAKGPVPAVGRAIELLACMARTPDVPLTSAELARQLGAARSSTRNLCHELEAGGLLRRSDGGFCLGPRLVEFGGAYLNSFDQVALFHEACAQSPVLAGELVQLAVLDGADVLYIARHEGRAPMSRSARVGDRLPAARTAIGIALLAAMGEETALRRAMGAGSPATDGAAVEQIAEKLRSVHKRGYAVDAGGFHPAVVGIAACVPLGVRAPLCAIGVSLIGTRPEPDDLARYGRALRAAAGQLAHGSRLGAL